MMVPEMTKDSAYAYAIIHDNISRVGKIRVLLDQTYVSTKQRT